MELMEQQIRKAHRNIDLLNQQARAIIKAAEELREFVMHVEERLESPKKHTLNSYTQ
jgi:hypothetical protein